MVYFFQAGAPFRIAPKIEKYGVWVPHIRVYKFFLMHRFILHMMAFRLEIPFKLAV